MPNDTFTSDPVTGEIAPVTSYSNTSNDNQIAVLSTIDYSTNTLNYYSYTDNRVTNVHQNAAYSYAGSNYSHGRGGGYHFRLDSDHYFNRDGMRVVDRIVGFSPDRGDVLELSRSAFEGIGTFEFQTVRDKAERKLIAQTDVDIIYQQNTGRLFFNSNGLDMGCGKEGGLFAILEGSPSITEANFMVI